jgi:hypothetical protein
MNIRDDDQVSAVALVVESEASTAAPVIENGTVPADEDLSPDETAPDPASDDDDV